MTSTVKTMYQKRVELTDEIKAAMIDAAKDAHPKEACGIISGARFYRLPNHNEAAGHFRLSAEDIADVARGNGGYEGVWHSHPSGRTEPSQTDWAFHPFGKALIIVAGDEVRVYYEEVP